jgi:hypothetical protein
LSPALANPLSGGASAVCDDLLLLHARSRVVAMNARGWRWVVAVLAATFAGSIALAFLSAWPSPRGGEWASVHREARIASAFQDFYSSLTVIVTRVRLGYLPHRAMVDADDVGNQEEFCAVVAEDFGDHLDSDDFEVVSCDF